jgi:ABC-type transport system substrate-binding protein
MQDSGKRRAKTVFCLGAAFALALLIAIACGGATEPDAAAPAEVAPPADTKPAAAQESQATSAPANVAPPVAMDEVNPGKVIFMTGSFGTERFDSTYGGTSPDADRHLHGYLVGSDVADGRLLVVPGIATQWEISDDLRSTIFTIREGVKFHDGSDLTVEDVVWSLNHYAGPTAPEYALGSLSLRYGKKMESIVAGPGQDQVTLTANVPMPEYATYGSKGAGGQALTKVLPKRAALHDEAVALAYDESPVAAGLLKLLEHRAGESMVFERFDDYYHQPDMGFSNDKRLQFQTIDYRLAKEEATRIAAIRAGEADMGRVSLGGRDQIEAGGGRLIMSPEARAWQVGLQGCFRSDIPCSDIRVRQALSYAIDRQVLRDQLYGPEMMEPKGWWVVTPSTIGYTPELDPPTFDPEKARQLLADAGYPGGEGFGPVIVNSYKSPYNPFMAESAQLGAEFWRRELGLEVEVRLHDPSALQREVVANPDVFDGQVLWRGQDTRLDAAGIMALYYLNKKQGIGYWKHSQQEIWDLGDGAMARLSKSDEQEIFNNLYMRLKDEGYHMGIGFIHIPYGVGPRIVTWEPYPVAEYFSALHTIRLK